MEFGPVRCLATNRSLRPKELGGENEWRKRSQRQLKVVLNVAISVLYKTVLNKGEHAEGVTNANHFAK